MIISIVNHSHGKETDAEILRVIRAINRQIHEDYEPYWSLSATLRLEGHSDHKTGKPNAADMRGDAVIYLWDKADTDEALGYHDKTNKGIPFGFVFLDIAKQLGEHWSTTLSHEALELIGDPEVNLLVAGPHPDPKEKGRTVFFWYEMSDAVQDETYLIDEVEVSNFVLPLYFTGGDEYDGRNDFLGTRAKDGSTLKSFGVNKGGYVGFYDPKTGDDQTYMRSNDKRARKRMEVKRKAKGTRRSVRYRRHGNAKSEFRLAQRER
jgi:hypothetical protein